MTAISAPRHGSRARTLVVDGEPWRTTSRSVVREAELGEGETYDLAELSDVLDALEPVHARRRAFALLHYRDRSEAELRARLTEDGYPSPVVHALVADLVRIDLVDDERLVGLLVRSLVARGYGRARILRELCRRGIGEPLAQDAIAAAVDIDGEYERALALARRHAPSARGDIRRLAARLARRGFQLGLAFDAARRALEDADALDTSGDVDLP